MTTAHPPEWGKVGYSTKEPEMTPAIAAGLCHGLPKHWFYAAQMKWAGSYDNDQYLIHSLMLEASKQPWQIKKYPGILRKLSRMAIEETRHPRDLDTHPKRLMFINYCGDNVLIKLEAYKKTWATRYEDYFYRTLEQWSANALRQIRANCEE